MKNLGVLLLCLFGLAACDSVEPPTTFEAPRYPGTLARGIDLPTDARDVSMELKGAQLDFVARYYRDPASRWPALSGEEARSISASGKKVVALWESHSHKPEYFSYAAGYADGMAAAGQAKRVGQPTGSAIYFAVDYNAPQSDIMGPIDRYFRGVLAGMIAAAGGRQPDYRIGVYGSGAVCAYLKGARLAQYSWLSNSTAWSGYGSFSDWNIKQSRGLASLSFSHDTNEARGDYGAFQIGGAGQLSSL